MKSKKFVLFLTTTCLFFSANVLLGEEPSAEEKVIVEHYTWAMDEPGAVKFSIPDGWLLQDPKQLPPSVKLMARGKGQSDLPPSLTFAWEPYSGTLDDYVALIKEQNAAAHVKTTDLGAFTTSMGKGKLLQVDFATERGQLRQLTLLIKKEENVYILIGSAAKEEFPQYYSTFFTTLRSVHMNESASTPFESEQATMKSGTPSSIETPG